MLFIVGYVYLQVLADGKDVRECCLKRCWDGCIVESLQLKKAAREHQKTSS